MSILIKGMDMPKGCGVCPLFDDECFGSYKCKRAKGWGDEENRAYDCPLREIPTPHGRLIDADMAIKEIAKAFLDKPWGGMDFGLKVEEIIDNIPEIIEAEE